MEHNYRSFGGSVGKRGKGSCLSVDSLAYLLLEFKVVVTSRVFGSCYDSIESKMTRNCCLILQIPVLRISLFYEYPCFTNIIDRDESAGVSIWASEDQSLICWGVAKW